LNPIAASDEEKVKDRKYQVEIREKLIIPTISHDNSNEKDEKDDPEFTANHTARRKVQRVRMNFTRILSNSRYRAKIHSPATEVKIEITRKFHGEVSKNRKFK
jgi:vancomycin resistance protein YoaR